MGYAVEMPRPVRAFHHLVQQPEIEYSRVFFRINVFYRGGQREVGARFFEQCQVGFHGSRVVFQIVRVVELGRIDENADDDRVAFPPALFDQRQVPLCNAPIVGTKPHVPGCRFSSSESAAFLVKTFIEIVFSGDITAFILTAQR